MVKKDSLIKGTLILTAAALVARVLGIFQRVPLEHAMDLDGQNDFGLANNVYLLLLVFATAGIPSAISKMVSERLVLGRKEEVNRIYRAAIIFGISTGIIMTVALLLGAPLYADLSGNPEGTLALRAIAPSLLLFPVIAMMRGYFQGRQFMMAGGVSQVVEQIARVFVAVGLVFALKGWGYNNEIMAAGGALGSVAGSIAAFAVMLYFARKLAQSDRRGLLEERAVAGRAGYEGPPVLTDNRSIYKAIFSISVPILLTAITVQAIYFIDSTTITPLSSIGFDKATVEFWMAKLVTNAQSIAGIPPVLAIALSTSILPVLSAAYAAGDSERVNRQATLALRIGIFSGTPIVLLMSVGAYVVNGSLFSGPDGSLIVGMLTGGTIFQITMMISNSILFGLGRQRAAMTHTLTGIAVKLVLTFALTPFMGVYGLLLATTACFLVATIWNMKTIRELTGVRALGDRWAGFTSTVAVIAVLGAGIVFFGLKLFEPLGWKWPYLLSTGIYGLVICVGYPILLVAQGVLRAEDLESYPARLRRLLRPFLRFSRRKAVTRG